VDVFLEQMKRMAVVPVVLAERFAVIAEKMAGAVTA
jgi:hypothetical protein